MNWQWENVACKGKLLKTLQRSFFFFLSFSDACHLTTTSSQNSNASLQLAKLLALLQQMSTLECTFAVDTTSLCVVNSTYIMFCTVVVFNPALNRFI